jgi:protoporphyrinogen oxidase
MSQRRQLGILGAGASGLSLALVSGLDYELLEKRSHPGGHASSTAVDGWVFDEGPHIMFSRDELLLQCLVSSLGSNIHRSKRNNRVAVAGAMARYPIENDLAALPLPLRSDCLVDMVRARERERETANLAEWFEANFGEALTDAYFRPYNEKLWKTPLESLSMTWADRIPQPPLEDVIRGALGEVSEGYLHQLYYSYPMRGGFSAIMAAWAGGVPEGRLTLGAEVTGLSREAEGVRVATSQGERLFERVVSTIPLPRLVELTAGVPDAVAKAVARLRVNPIITATIGFAGEDPNQYTAVYIPDPDYLANRVSYPAVFSPHNAPPGCFSVQAEITCAPGSEVLTAGDEFIATHVLDGLRERRLVPDNARPIFTSVQRFEQGYVVYTNGYEEDVRIASEWFEGQGVILHGRFGSHDYLNVDGCLRRSIDLSRRLGAGLDDGDVLQRFQALAAAS